MPEAKTIRDVIDDSGRIIRFRWWLFKRLSHLLYWICPEPHRTHLYIMWHAKMGEFMEAANRLSEEKNDG